MGKGWTSVHRDANHIEIVKFIKDDLNGKYSVVDLAAVGQSVPDIIVANDRVTALFEIKMPKSQIYIGQLEFLAAWPGIAAFAENVDDVLHVMEDPAKYQLTEMEKVIIREICAEYREKTVELKPRIRMMEFEKRYAEAKAHCGIVK